MDNKKIETNWYVITGGPSTGKTTVINLLKEMGFKTTIEHARHYIDSKKVFGNSLEEIRANKRKFQLGVLNMQIAQEAELPAAEFFFLDRAIPDTMAYIKYLNLEYDKVLLDAVNKATYKKIFILDRLPFVKDYARTEDEEAQKNIHQLIIEVYESLGSPIIFVPVLSPQERVVFILNNI